MTNYGPHNDVISAFLEQVRTADLETWHALAIAAMPTQVTLDATRALTTVKLPASVRTSVHSAAVRAFRDLHLQRDDFPGRRDMPRVEDAIDTACMAIAARDQLSPEHLHALLDPFVQVGFDAARAALQHA